MRILGACGLQLLSRKNEQIKMQLCYLCTWFKVLPMSLAAR